MERSTERTWKAHLGKLIVALTGLCTIVGHYLVNVTHKSEVRQEVTHAVLEQRYSRERDFVRKQDLEKVVKPLADRMDDTADKVEELSERTAQLEGYLKAKDRRMSEETVLFWRRANRKARR